MKFIYLILFTGVLTAGCKKNKDVIPEKTEQQKLDSMRKNIINDWKIFKIMTVKPVSQYGTIHTSLCEDGSTFSFNNDSTFNYTYGPSCFSAQKIYGWWKLPKTDSLFITFDSWHIGAYENLAVTTLKADTMKWNIISASATGLITVEYTLIPK